jgi:peptide/nickel transport system permease protein
MWKYILRRTIYLLPTLLGITILVFTIVRLIPGDPAEIILGQRATEDVIIIIRQQMGLDRPIYIQYLIWIRFLLVGNWGKSLISNASTTYLISNRFARTVNLAVLSMALISGLGILLGVISAYKVGTRIDNALRFFMILTWSLPSFLVGILLIYIFALKLKMFPALGAGSLRHLVLPALATSTGGVAYIGRITRGALLEVSGQDFVKTARAKGLKRTRILFTHILRNALLPIITVLGMSFSWALSGSFIVETIFSYPGIGFLITQSVSNRDYPIVQGCILFTAIIYSVTNLIVDVLYVYLDPRIRYERRM